MDETKSHHSRVLSGLFGILTARMEDGAELAARGQRPCTDHAGTAGDLISLSAEMQLLAKAAELLAKAQH